MLSSLIHQLFTSMFEFQQQGSWNMYGFDLIHLIFVPTFLSTFRFRLLTLWAPRGPYMDPQRDYVIKRERLPCFL